MSVKVSNGDSARMNMDSRDMREDEVIRQSHPEMDKQKDCNKKLAYSYEL